MKKFIALLLAAMMVMSMFAGCQSASEQTATTAAQDQPTGEQAAADTGAADASDTASDTETS